MGFRQWLLACTLVALTCHASAEESRANELFQTGVAQAERSEWTHASASFEEALSLEDRPSLRFNLVLAYAALEQPLEVVRHALAFMALPLEPHRAEARARVAQELEAAQHKLARLDTRELPSDVHLRVDGAEPVRDGEFAYVRPGEHRLETRSSEGAAAESIDVNLALGSTIPWPLAREALVPTLSAPTLSPELSHAPSAPAPTHLLASPHTNLESTQALLRAHEARLRKRLAWALGIAGALGLATGATSYGIAQHLAREIRESDPYAENTPVITSSRPYIYWSNSVAPTAVAGAALISGAILVGDHSTHQRSQLWDWAALGSGIALAASGLTLVAREPERVGESNLDEATRPAGALLASMGAALITFGVTSVVRRFSRERSPGSLAQSGKSTRP